MVMLSQKPDLVDIGIDGPLAALVGKRSITREDVALLRSSDVAFGIRSRAEAEMMFAIERQRGDRCRAWGEFLVEALTDFAVWDQRPSGVLTEEAALWLSDQVGEKPTPACLALLVAVLDEVETVPAWFVPAVRVRATKVFGRRAREALQHAA